MALRKECKYCGEHTIAKRMQGFYLGSNSKIKLWECRNCKGIWSEK